MSIDVKNGNGFYFVNVYFEDKKEEDFEEIDDSGRYGPAGTFRLSKETGKVDQIYTEHTGRQRFLFYFFIMIVGKKLDRPHLATLDPGFTHFLQWKCKVYNHGPSETPNRVNMKDIDLEKITCFSEKDIDDIKIVMN